jgi:DNA replication protein DnaC
METLTKLRLTGMVKSLEELLNSSAINGMSAEEVVGILADREYTDRENRRTNRRLKSAKLRLQAMIEDIDWKVKRGLDKTAMTALFSCDWIKRKQHVIFTGLAGTGKTWLSCALAEKACREGYSTKFIRYPRLFTELATARIDGSMPKYLAKLAKIDLLVLDDWGQQLGEVERRELFEIIEDRNERSSIIITSQHPVASLHATIGDPTIADAIFDRIVHRAHEFSLSGPSLRDESNLTKKK